MSCKICLNSQKDSLCHVDLNKNNFLIQKMRPSWLITKNTNFKKITFRSKIHLREKVPLVIDCIHDQTEHQSYLLNMLCLLKSLHLTLASKPLSDSVSLVRSNRWGSCLPLSRPSHCVLLHVARWWCNNSSFLG